MVLEEKELNLYEDSNTSDVFNRSVIAGLLKILNKELVYTQIWDESEQQVEKVTVPFFYDFGGGNPNSEKFIQDNYIFFGSNVCTEIGIKKIDGNFDIYPQGRVSLSSVTIQSSSITNRFVLGKFNKKVDGQYKTYVAFLYSIPLDFSFNIEIRSENLNTAFKIDQAFREFFYRNKTFYINFRGMKIGCRAGFPDSNTMERSSTYNMGSGETDKYIKMAYTVSVESYQPVFDKDSEMLESNRIKTLSHPVSVGDSSNEVRHLEFSNELENQTLVASSEVLLEWKFYTEVTDTTSVKLSYHDYETGQDELIAYVADSNFYNWEVPRKDSTSTLIDTIIPNSSTIQIYENPKIIVVPDPRTKIVSPSNVYIKSKGFFTVKGNEVQGYFSYLVDKTGELHEVPFTLNLRNGMIDPTNPISFDCFVYKNEIKTHTIDLVIEDISNNQISDTIKNITLI